MRPPAATRVTFAPALESGRRIGDRRLRSRDERREAVDSTVGGHRLRLRLILRLRAFPMFAWFTITMLTWLTMFACLAVFALVTVFARLAMLTLFARLLLVALIGLVVAALALTAVAHERLRLLLGGNEAGLLAEMREALALVVEIVDGQILGVARLRLVLAELLLSSGNQAEIVLGMLVVILRGDGISRRAGITGKLDVFLGNMGGSPTDLDVRSVRLEHPGQRVLAAPVIIAAVPVAHPLVVLTVSHVLPLFPPCVRSIVIGICIEIPPHGPAHRARPKREIRPMPM